jgi:hypothetical protein
MSTQLQPATFQPGHALLPPRPQPGTNGLAIAGLVLAVLLAPVGLILSVVGLVQARRRGEKGRGLAITGILVSTLLTASVGVAAHAAYENVSTLIDPGCTVANSTMRDNHDMVRSPATLLEGLRAIAVGLASAERQAKDDEVRAAVQALRRDYSRLIASVEAGQAPDPSLASALKTEAADFDALCSTR